MFSCTWGVTTTLSFLWYTFRSKLRKSYEERLAQYKSKLGKIWVQIEAQHVYFPMKQISLKNSLRVKSYGQNSEQMSFFSIVFKMIWALLSCNYYQTIKISFVDMSSSSLGPGTKVYIPGTKWGVYTLRSSSVTANCHCLAVVVFLLTRFN